MPAPRLLVDVQGNTLPSLRSAGGRPQAVSQAHGHHHAVLGNDADTELIHRAGLNNQPLASRCCGLAGNFGMTPDHRGVSLAVGEQVLLPAGPLRRRHHPDPRRRVLLPYPGPGSRYRPSTRAPGRGVNAALRGVTVDRMPE